VPLLGQRLKIENKNQNCHRKLLVKGWVLLAARDLNGQYLILKRTERPATDFGGFPEIQCYSG
jgi:hypothetical protein